MRTAWFSHAIRFVVVPRAQPVQRADDPASTSDGLNNAGDIVSFGSLARVSSGIVPGLEPLHLAEVRSARLRAYLADNNDKQAAALFVEFAKTFEGKRQLHWSAGLKQRLAIGVKTDEQLAAVQDDFARLLGTITLDQWRYVLAVDGRAKVLVLAAADGWDAVLAYLGAIRRDIPALMAKP